MKNVALGIAQILLWGGSYFILSVLAEPIMKETGWTYQMVYGCLSVSLLVSGLLLPSIGKLISSSERNFVLQYAGVVMALGLTVLGLSEHFLLFLLGWTIIGVAMGMGLYDALFASIGKNYGEHTSKAIVQVTLIASLAPTISWSLVSMLESSFNWRTTCFIYAAILLLTIFPIHSYVFPSAKSTAANPHEGNQKKAGTKELYRSKIYYLLLINFTLGAILTTGIVVHLIDILLDKKLAMATVLSIVAFLGPSQAGVRVLNLVLSNITPVKTAIVSAFASVAGILLFFLDPRGAFLGVIFFGMGNGMRSILRGTLPLSVFGQEHYAVMIGQLARLPLIAQALTPFAGGFLIQQFGVTVFLYAFLLLACINIILCYMIRKALLQQKTDQESILVERIPTDVSLSS